MQGTDFWTLKRKCMDITDTSFWHTFGLLGLDPSTVADSLWLMTLVSDIQITYTLCWMFFLVHRPQLRRARFGWWHYFLTYCWMIFLVPSNHFKRARFGWWQPCCWPWESEIHARFGHFSLENRDLASNLMHSWFSSFMAMSREVFPKSSSTPTFKVSHSTFRHKETFRPVQQLVYLRQFLTYLSH